jgi:L-methionine (R)-S-oxide reductase
MASLLEELPIILARDTDRTAKGARIAEAIREAGPYRWAGIYDVDSQRGIVCNIAWSGPNAPTYPTFRIGEGLTSRAIIEKKTVNVGDVTSDSDYLTALENTRSEIIVPVLDGTGDRVIGTIDVESERFNAFDSKVQSLLEECASILRTFWTSYR